MRILAFSADLEAVWDEFIARSGCSTFLHTRKFLGYHGARFEDRSLVFHNQKDGIVAVCPAATSPDDRSIVISHPGATYGGIIFGRGVPINEAEAMLDLAIGYYRNLGFSSWLYKCTPPHLQPLPNQVIDYLFWRAGAILIRRDLWNVIRLGNLRVLTKGRRWGVRKALKRGVAIMEESKTSAYETFYDMLCHNLKDRYNVCPTHSLSEMLVLRDHCPENISLWICADSDGSMLSGAWVFKLGHQAWHTQYIASFPLGRKSAATDALLEAIIIRAEEVGIKYFSFGASTESAGRHYNSGLFAYKSGFGFGAVVQDFFMLDLNA